MCNGPRVSRVSILNDVLGPVMRGPSSSHTAGSYHIAQLAKGLLGAKAVAVDFAFDPAGSYAQVYREQGVDRAFAAGLLGWPLTDARFFDGLTIAPRQGLDLRFGVRPLAHADHPNTVEIHMCGDDGRTLAVRARSVGGGAVEVVDVEGWTTKLTGDAHEVLVEVPAGLAARAVATLSSDGQVVDAAQVFERKDRSLVDARRLSPLAAETRAALGDLGHDVVVREAPPIGFVKRGPQLFQSAAEMLALAESRQWTLGRTALAYEAALLGLPEQAIVDEVARRFDIMVAAVHLGLDAAAPPMQQLAPTAHAIFAADAAGRLALGGLHTRAAVRAMAVMHVNSAMGVVCAAPTGGSAGTPRPWRC
jgi:L-serine dehydratase